MRKLLCLFVVAYLSVTYNELCAQKNTQPLISGNFTNLPAEQFFLEIEKQSGYHFYYDTAMLDSLKVNIVADKLPLLSLLQQALEKTSLAFASDKENNIFISKGLKVQTELPAGFFSGKAAAKDSSSGRVLADLQDKHTQQKSLQENKLYEIGGEGITNNTGRYILTGYIRDVKTGEPVIGASINSESKSISASTDQYGYYSISLPKGHHVLNIQSIGMKDMKMQLQVKGDGKMNIDMQSQVMTLRGVVVSAEKAGNVRGLQMGVQKIDIKAIKQVPVVFGEADVLKVVLTMPGVKSVGEASTGLNVRGGSADQNLILFNDATIYNPAHFFGMFSSFNPEVVKDVELYKSSIPAKYGGRLSSVVEIASREGNKKNISGSAGIGVLTSRMNIEGPLVKDKSSFILGARATYANWLLNLLPDKYKDSKAGFYDINFNINHELNKKNTLFFTAYLSRDRFNLNSDTAYKYGNQNLSLKWKHIFGNKLYFLVTGGYDHYQYNISSEKNPVNAYSLGFDINQYYFKTHFNYYLSPKHTLEFGVSSIYYKLHPGTYKPLGKESLVAFDEMQQEQALESAVYLSDKYSITNDFSIEAGARYSVYNYLGPHDVNTYPSGIPKTTDNITGTISYPSGKFIKTYKGPEARVSARYSLSSTLSVKAGYNTQRQFIHMLSNTAAMAPTDIWKLSDPNIRPQYGDQVSLGLYKNLKSNTIETSLEVYYKRITDFLDYKSGAILVMNHHIETDVINTKGKAYGIEFLIKKTTGKLNGWFSYTFSRTLLKMDDPSAGEIINKGMYYPANYDKPHDATFTGNYRFSHRFSVSLNATYSTGRPITLPIGRFFYSGGERTLFADRNSFRIPDYFRTDFSMNIEGNHKVHQKTHNSWTIGVYNLTGRKNPYSVYFISEGGVINGYKLSIFGSAIPYVNFNIRF